jgi:hypothetical protein
MVSFMASLLNRSSNLDALYENFVIAINNVAFNKDLKTVSYEDSYRAVYEGFLLKELRDKCIIYLRHVVLGKKIFHLFSTISIRTRKIDLVIVIENIKPLQEICMYAMRTR